MLIRFASLRDAKTYLEQAYIIWGIYEHDADPKVNQVRRLCDSLEVFVEQHVSGQLIADVASDLRRTATVVAKHCVAQELIDHVDIELVEPDIKEIM